MTLPQIVKESGGSVMRFKDAATARLESGASLIVDSGASIHGFGNIQVESAACLNLNDGGSIKIKPTATTGSIAYSVFSIGNNTLWYTAGCGGSPVFSASPGDLLWFANSASTGIYVNRSDGTAGSVWLLWGYDSGSNQGAGV